MNKTTIILLSLLLCCCYQAKNISPSGTPPVFKMTAGGYPAHNYYGSASGNPLDSVMTFTVNNQDSLTIAFNFSLESGDPANYFFSIWVDSLSSGITTSRDSSRFRLPYVSYFTLHVNIADTGFAFVKFGEYNSITGSSAYTFRVHVLPVPPPPDCASCFAAATMGRNSCSGDSCHFTVSLIPGIPHWVNISNINCLGDSVIVQAYVSCDSGIHISPQTTHGYTIYGRSSVVFCGGYFSYPIYDTIIYGGDTSACIFQLKNF